MLKQGTIILVPFPFTDLSGNKIRPALVVARPFGDDVVVIFLSSKKARKLYQFDVRINHTADNGLKVPSVLKCSKIATLDKKVILGELGVISSADMKKIKSKLRKIFGI